MEWNSCQARRVDLEMGAWPMIFFGPVVGRAPISGPGRRCSNSSSHFQMPRFQPSQVPCRQVFLFSSHLHGQSPSSLPNLSFVSGQTSFCQQIAGESSSKKEKRQQGENVK